MNWTFLLRAWNCKYVQLQPLRYLMSRFLARMCFQSSKRRRCSHAAFNTSHHLEKKKKVTQSAICSLHCAADVQTKLTSHSFSKHLGILWSIRSPDTDLKSVESDVSRWLLFSFGRDGVIAPGRRRPWGPLGHFVFFVFFGGSIRQMGKLLFVERPCCFGSGHVSDWLCHCAGACDWN